MDVAELRALIANRLPSSYKALQLTFYGQRSQQNGEHLVIGDDYGTELRARLIDGAVYSTDPEGTLPTRFVNSGIEQLARFIEVYRSYAGRAKSDAEVAPFAQRMRNELAAIDPTAFGDPENWWAVVLEQVEDGLL